MLQYAMMHFQSYIIVLLRVAAFIGTSPVLSIRAWPNPAKLGLAAFTAMLIVPVHHVLLPDVFKDPGGYIVIALQETAVGMLLGFTATLVFNAFQIAGQVFDYQSGLSFAAMFDPASGQSTGITGSFLSVLFTLFFLGVNGLDGLTLAILHSYEFVPIGKLHLQPDYTQYLTHLLGIVMVLAIQVAAPMLTALLLTDITFALISRAVPQMNVFIVGVPLKLFVGFSFFAAVMPGLVYLFNQLFGTLFEQLNTLLGWLGGA
jgi:flagellar biosynthesis protein FliR